MLLLNGHTDRVRGLAYAPDGRTLASGSNDRTIKLWDLREGRERATWRRTRKNVYTLAFSPDGRLLASGGGDKAVTLWDVAEGRIRAVLRGHTMAVSGLGFAPDGTLASVAGDRTGFYPGGEAIVWDLDAGRHRILPRDQNDGIWCMAWAPDGRSLAYGTGSGLVVRWDRTAPTSEDLPDVSAFVQGVAMPPPSLRWMVNQAHPLALAYRSDGGLLAATAGWSIKLWEPAGARPSSILKGHTERVLALAASPVAPRLASAGRDRTVRIWDFSGPDPGDAGPWTPSGRDPGAVVGGIAWQIGPIDCLAYSPDGTTLAAGGEREVVVWDVDEGS